MAFAAEHFEQGTEAVGSIAIIVDDQDRPRRLPSAALAIAPTAGRVLGNRQAHDEYLVPQPAHCAATTLPPCGVTSSRWTIASRMPRPSCAPRRLRSTCANVTRHPQQHLARNADTACRASAATISLPSRHTAVLRRRGRVFSRHCGQVVKALRRSSRIAIDPRSTPQAVRQSAGAAPPATVAAPSSVTVYGIMVSPAAASQSDHALGDTKRDLQQVIDQTNQAKRFAGLALHQGLCVRDRGRIAVNVAQHLQALPDRRQWIAQLVRERRQELILAAVSFSKLDVRRLFSIATVVMLASCVNSASSSMLNSPIKRDQKAGSGRGHLSSLPIRGTARQPAQRMPMRGNREAAPHRVSLELQPASCACETVALAHQPV